MKRSLGIEYEKNVKGYIHSVETAGMVDGPGIRYVVFFSGCNLRCKYCHNPDTWKMEKGQLFPVEDVVWDIKKYKSYLHFSGGGVTITGGEPFMQPHFLEELLKACKSEGIHTALDTAGHVPADVARRVLRYTDLLLLDLKSMNSEVYKDVTGVRIDLTLKVLALSCDMSVPVWIRFVLVPGLTDDEDDMRKMAEFLKPFPNIERVEVLPFHKLGEYKWAELGLTYTLKDTEPPTKQQIDRAREILAYDKTSVK